MKKVLVYALRTAGLEAAVAICLIHIKDSVIQCGKVRAMNGAQK